VSRRIVLGLLSAVVVLGLVLTALNARPEAAPPARDGWTSGEPGGVGGWAAVLAREGVRLRVRDVDPSDLQLLPGTTYLFGEDALDDADARRVAREARRGSHVVAVGRDAWRIARVLRLDAPGGEATGDAVRVAREPETAAVGAVARDGAVWPSTPPRARPLLAVGERAVAVAVRVGRGRVVLVPDRGIVENAGLVRADNAAFAVALAGRGRVVALRPREEATAFGGVPARAVTVVLLLVLAAGAAMLSRGRRLGPPTEPDEPPSPGRSAYVDALAALLARTPDRGRTAERLRARGRAVLARRVGLPPDPTPDDVRAAARRAGLDDADAAALAGTGPSSATPVDVRAVGRALARLEGDPA
jgi:hypothetical protein